MKRSKHSLLVWFALVVVALTVGVAMTSATTVVAPTFEQMIDRAELIFVGKVVGSSSEWRDVGTKRVIVTQIEFERQEILKGDAGPSVTLQFLGGTIGDVSLKIAGVPKFNVGDRELLFVKGNGVQFSPVVGVSHGKFAVRKDQKLGRDILIRHDGKELHDIAEIGASAGVAGQPESGSAKASLSEAADATPLSFDDFKSKIRARLAASSAKKK